MKDYQFLVSVRDSTIARRKHVTVTAESPDTAKSLACYVEHLTDPMVVAFMIDKRVFHSTSILRSDARLRFEEGKRFASVEGRPDLTDYFNDLIEDEL